MNWGRWISSPATQIALTVAIFMLALFVMGFLADPIINLSSEPYLIFFAPSKVVSRIEPIFTDDEVPTWSEHFVKGLAATGLLGFAKVAFAAALSPWHWWNLRTTGIIGGGNRSGNTGRDRMANISWLVVLIGVVTFLIVLVRFSPCISLADSHRLCTKACDHGAEECWRKLVRGLWMLQVMMKTRTTMKNLTARRNDVKGR